MARRPVGKKYSIDELKEIRDDLKSLTELVTTLVDIVEIKKPDSIELPQQNIQYTKQWSLALHTVAVGNTVKLRFVDTEAPESEAVN